jgi:hypothetical protein
MAKNSVSVQPYLVVLEPIVFTNLFVAAQNTAVVRCDGPASAHLQQRTARDLHLYHKVLTYVEYRAVSGVFQNINPPTPSPPSYSVSSPRTKGRGYTLAGRWGGGGQYFGRRQPDIGLASYSIISLRPVYSRADS